MSIIKSYTDLEQSKKLAEILLLESADMRYEYSLKEKDDIQKPIIGFSISSMNYYKNIGLIKYFPCWSLASLFKLLKDRIIFGGNSPEGWFCCYTIKNPTKTLTIYEDSLVDACYKLIIKLHELNLLWLW